MTQTSNDFWADFHARKQKKNPKPRRWKPLLLGVGAGALLFGGAVAVKAAKPTFALPHAVATAPAPILASEAPAPVRLAQAKPLEAAAKAKLDEAMKAAAKPLDASSVAVPPPPPPVTPPSFAEAPVPTKAVKVEVIRPETSPVQAEKAVAEEKKAAALPDLVENRCEAIRHAKAPSSKILLQAGLKNEGWTISQVVQNGCKAHGRYTYVVWAARLVDGRNAMDVTVTLNSNGVERSGLETAAVYDNGVLVPEPVEPKTMQAEKPVDVKVAAEKAKAAPAKAKPRRHARTMVAHHRHHRVHVASRKISHEMQAAVGRTLQTAGIELDGRLDVSDRGNAVVGVSKKDCFLFICSQKKTYASFNMRRGTVKYRFEGERSVVLKVSVAPATKKIRLAGLDSANWPNE